MPILVLLAALQVSLPVQDSALFLAREAMLRVYTNCDEDRWPWGLAETFVPKTSEEVFTGIRTREVHEARWRAYFTEHAGDSIAPTPEAAWVYPLAVRGRLLNNFNNPRQGGPHEALDIFVVREGVTVRSPISGVVVAAGDDWVGGWTRREGLRYDGGGLSRRAGNGAMIFDPASGAYVYFAHLQSGVLVRTGDVVRAGQVLGKVGHTGNAAAPGRGKHLHFAYKRAGSGCGFDGVLVSVNPYRLVRAARGRMR
jgi:murein DD-endopeptidase MepM/ murein hydrolase activator NlpD